MTSEPDQQVPDDEAATTEFVSALGAWTKGGGPLHRRLADAIEAGIRRGDIEAGARLPAERRLAELLVVSRSTVTAAYEALGQRDVLSRRRGSGTYVSDASARSFLSKLSVTAHSALTLRAPAGSVIEFTTAALPALDVFTDEHAERAADEVRRLQHGHGYYVMGLPALREAIAERFTQQGIATDGHEILITAGAQQAIFLVAHLLLGPGHEVIVEDPTWLGAIDAYRSTRARLNAVPLDQHGPISAALRAEIASGGPRLIHVSPSVNNPTGILMSNDRRAELARLADEHQVPLLEDNALADLMFSDPAPACLAAYARKAPVFSVGSFSKLLWGGLRVGWVRANAETITKLANLKLIVDHGSALQPQVLVLQRMRDLAEVRQTRLTQIQPRREALVSAIREHLPGWQWHDPAGGLSLWMQMPRGDATEFAQVAQRSGVAIVPGVLASPRGGSRGAFRLPFVLEPDRITEGVRRLSDAWHTYQELIDHRRLQSAVV